MKKDRKTHQLCDYNSQPSSPGVVNSQQSQERRQRDKNHRQYANLGDAQADEHDDQTERPESGSDGRQDEGAGQAARVGDQWVGVLERIVSCRKSVF